MKRIFYLALILIAGFYAIRYIVKYQPRVQNTQALNNVVTIVPMNSPRPTDTPLPTMTPFPTVDYQSTERVYQLVEQQERDRMVEVHLQHDENMLAQQVELARIGATQTYAPTAIAFTEAANTLESGRQKLEAGYLTATNEAPAKAAQLLQVANNAKNEKRDNIIFIVMAIATMIFLIVVPMGIFRLAKTYEAAKTVEYDPADYEPVPAQEGIIEIPQDGINRRMEQRFAIVLLAMHALKPNDEAVSLLESFWVVRGGRDKFQNRNEFLAVRDDWASDKNGILLRVDPSIANSTFYVAKWDEVQLIANGSKLQPPPQDGFIPYSRQK